MNVLVIEPGHGSVWLTHAAFVDRFGNPNPRGRFVDGLVWSYDGGWNMPDDYQGQYEGYRTRRRFILKVETDTTDPEDAAERRFADEKIG